MSALFDIWIDNLYWVNGSKDDADDLCLHGDVQVDIGEEKFKYSATVSATALYLLKTISEDHLIGQDNQMLPCCGFFMIPNELMDTVHIMGCPNGIDWSVTHEGSRIKLITESGSVVYVDLAEYKKKVFEFADKIEEYYKQCSTKNLPADKYERDGYFAFWNEWHRRRTQSNF